MHTSRVNATHGLLLLAGVLLAPLALAQSSGGFGAYQVAPVYDEVHTSSLYLPMRDGVKIAIQIMRPARDGKPAEGRFPVIWQAGLSLPGPPANATGARALGDWSRLVRQGYVIVDVARRAHGPSFGIRRSYHDREEAYDAWEITEWLAAQPWSDGNVGMHGCSNTGEAVMHALTVDPPHLKAAWAGCFSWSKYDGILRGGGIIANWGSGPTRTLEEDMRERPVDGDESRTLLRQAAEGHLQSVDLFALAKTIPYRDSFSPLTRSRFAVEGSAGTYAPQLRNANIPLYIQGGWYDDFRKEGFIALANMPDTHLIIGPWTHCANDDFDLIGEAQRFFDYYLKGIDTGIARDAPVHYFVVGTPDGKGWHSASAWFPASANSLNMHLAADTLSSAAPDSGKVSFVTDYGTTCSSGGGGGPASVVLIQPCHPTTGAVSFRGPVLQSAVELTGHPVVNVWVSSANTRDARLFAYLEDVAPDGTVTALTEGRQKVSLRRVVEAPWNYLGLPWHRGYAEDEQFLKKDEPVQVAIDLLPLSYVVPAGHRIQISVAGADPRERLRDEEREPQLTIHYGGSHDSTVSLPAR